MADNAKDMLNGAVGSIDGIIKPVTGMIEGVLPAGVGSVFSFVGCEHAGCGCLMILFFLLSFLFTQCSATGVNVQQSAAEQNSSQSSESQKCAIDGCHYPESY